MWECCLAAATTPRPSPSPRRQSVTTASKAVCSILLMASRAEVDAVAVWPACARIAHLSVTTCGSSSTQRILAISGPCRARVNWSAAPAAAPGSRGKSALTLIRPPAHVNECLMKSVGPVIGPQGLHCKCHLFSCLRRSLSDALGLREQQQVVRPAGFGVRARHVETAKGMRAHHGARALAIDVQVADVELVHRALLLLRRTGIDSAGQAEFRVVGDLERVIEIAGLGHRQHRPEDL